MRPFTIQELQLLLAPHPAPCISLFLPTHRHHPGIEQDRIRFKNLLGTTKDLLRERYALKNIRSFIEPVEALSTDDFWQYQMEGLAVFRSLDLIMYYRLPIPLPEVAVVADSFHIKPLLGFLQSNRRFFVLTLSQNSVVLYEGTLYGLGMVDLPELPTSLAEELGIERRESFLNLHSYAADSNAAIFHGHGMPADDKKKEDLTRFFRAIDSAVWEVLREERAPLILVGVGYYHSLYRSVSRYRYLAEHGVEGNFERTTPDEIHAKVWPIVSELFKTREEEVLSEYTRLTSRGRGTDDLRAIARAAVNGQVHQLLVAEGAHLWGRLDRQTGTVGQHPAQQDTRDDDILDDLAECVIARGGEVLLLHAGRLPSASPVAGRCAGRRHDLTGYWQKSGQRRREKKRKE